jgi:hypothetical protein
MTTNEYITNRHPHYIECECGDFAHIIRFTIDDDYTCESPITLETRMSHFLPWYRRIVLAFRYIFKLDTTAIQYGETIIPPETFPKLRALLDEAEALGQAKCDKLAKEILDQRKENGNE